MFKFEVKTSKLVVNLVNSFFEKFPSPRESRLLPSKFNSTLPEHFGATFACSKITRC